MAVRTIYFLLFLIFGILTNVMSLLQTPLYYLSKGFGHLTIVFLDKYKDHE